jgi:LuxR family maltose regulon positive regulatory protein
VYAPEVGLRASLAETGRGEDAERAVTVDSAPTLALVAEPQPQPRPGLVRRTRLLRRLVGCDAPVVLLVAPAGYGKTALLRDWAQRDGRPFAWVSFSTGRRAEAVLTRLLHSAAPGQVIVADDAHLAAPAVMRRLLDAASTLPAGATLALATRSRPDAPLGRQRVERQLV